MKHTKKCCNLYGISKYGTDKIQFEHFIGISVSRKSVLKYTKD
jgi:hypothetical protein